MTALRMSHERQRAGAGIWYFKIPPGIVVYRSTSKKHPTIPMTDQDNKTESSSNAHRYQHYPDSMRKLKKTVHKLVFKKQNKNMQLHVFLTLAVMSMKFQFLTKALLYIN